MVGLQRVEWDDGLVGRDGDGEGTEAVGRKEGMGDESAQRTEDEGKMGD